jgi:hypothetical protein
MKFKAILLLLPLAFASTGCTSFDKMMHELQPHRLWRINSGPAPGRTDSAYFSVHDVEAEKASSPGPADPANVQPFAEAALTDIGR